jgi:DNA-binding NtrC family response regulator
MSAPVKMLVADDSVSIHAIFREAAARSSLPLLMVEADNGRECMDLLRQGDVALAFIDVFMPKMSGLEALTNARFVGNKTFVTLMSGRHDDRCIALARELNAYEFLAKPIRFREVAAIIKTFERVHRTMRALIVDDSATVRSIIRRVLDRSIFRLQVEEAADGETALELCRHANFDVIFLDCNMPRLHGLDALRLLRARRHGARVVMISSQRNEDQERDAMARGAAAFLHKPFYPVAIDALVHRMFGLRSPTLTITKPGVLRDFDVTIVGRTVAVAHKESGHLFEYLWFCEAPHLRSTHVVSNDAAPVHPGIVRSQAEKAALLELKTARLVN